MQKRLGITRRHPYCESLHLDAPAVVGGSPVVLLPMSALTGLTDLQLRAIIAHELSHIRDSTLLQPLSSRRRNPAVLPSAVCGLANESAPNVRIAATMWRLRSAEIPLNTRRALALMEEWRVAPIFSDGRPIADRLFARRFVCSAWPRRKQPS